MKLYKVKAPYEKRHFFFPFAFYGILYCKENYCWYADKTKEDHGSFSLDQYEQAEAVSK